MFHGWLLDFADFAKGDFGKGKENRRETLKGNNPGD